LTAPAIPTTRPPYRETVAAELARVEDERDHLARRVEELEADLTEAERIFGSALGRRHILLDLVDTYDEAEDHLSARLSSVESSRDGWRLVSAVFTLGFIALGLGSC